MQTRGFAPLTVLVDHQTFRSFRATRVCSSVRRLLNFFSSGRPQIQNPTASVGSSLPHPLPRWAHVAVPRRGTLYPDRPLAAAPRLPCFSGSYALSASRRAARFFAGQREQQRGRAATFLCEENMRVAALAVSNNRCAAAFLGAQSARLLGSESSSEGEPRLSRRVPLLHDLAAMVTNKSTHPTAWQPYCVAATRPLAPPQDPDTPERLQTPTGPSGDRMPRRGAAQRGILRPWCRLSR